MKTEWNRDKAVANRAKHGVDFSDAAVALEDEFALAKPDPDAQGEDRFVSLGMDAHGRLLVTVYTIREERVRIISRRLASGGGRGHYERR